MRFFLLVFATMLLFCAFLCGLLAYEAYMATRVIDKTNGTWAVACLLLLWGIAAIFGRLKKNDPIDLSLGFHHNLQRVMLGSLLMGFGAIGALILTPMLHGVFKHEVERGREQELIESLPVEALRSGFAWLLEHGGVTAGVAPFGIFAFLLMLIGHRLVRP